MAGVIGTLAGFTGAETLLAYFRQLTDLELYGFVPVALGGMGSNRGALTGGLALGLFQQAANFLVGGIFAAGGIRGLILGCCSARRPGGYRHGQKGLIAAHDRYRRRLPRPPAA